MMLQLWGDKRTQDEIAEFIFDMTGSKFSDTVSYLEELGYEYRYFKGNVENYKRLLDQGIPVLLSIDIEHASHVQVLAGYDDMLQAFMFKIRILSNQLLWNIVSCKKNIVIQAA